MPEDPAARNGLYAGMVPAMVINPAKFCRSVFSNIKMSVTRQVFQAFNWSDWFNLFNWFGLKSTNSTNETNKTNLTCP